MIFNKMKIEKCVFMEKQNIFAFVTVNEKNKQEVQVFD